MIPHRDEILRPAVSTDATAVPRYDLVRPDGTIIEKNVAIRLANPVAREGTPISKAVLDEMLAASGVTAGTETAYTLAQEEYTLFDGAEVRFRLHTASGSGATLNVNGTGAKPLRDAMGESMASGMPAGTWMKAIYSAAKGAYTISGGAGGGSNENLIDNWYFADPVNSRGQTEYRGAWTYSADRWKLGGAGSYAILRENGMEIGADCQQAVLASELTGEKYTLSVLSADGRLGTYTFAANDDFSVDAGICYLVGYADDDRRWFRIYGTGGIYTAVKLELGSTQTLAHQGANGNWILNDPPPDKGMELLKCIQSTADPNDNYANKIIIHTGNMTLITPKDIGALSISGDTMGGALKANASAVSALGTAQVRNVTISATDLTAGSSALATGDSYRVYS